VCSVCGLLLLYDLPAISIPMDSFSVEQTIVSRFDVHDNPVLAADEFLCASCEHMHAQLQDGKNAAGIDAAMIIR
jgi:hypothetical protein